MGDLLVTDAGLQVYLPDGEVLERFFWDRSKFSCIQGPIGSGTSTAGVHKLNLLSLEQEPDHDGVRRSKWLIIGRSYPNLRETVLKTWDIWFKEEVYGPRVRAEPGYHRFIDPKTGGPRPHPSGDGTYVDAEFIFLALPNGEVARQILPSWEITGFFANEIQFLDKDIITIALTRCGRFPSVATGSGATWFGGFADMNAPIEGHWVPYMRGDIPLPPDMSEEEAKGYEKPENWRFFVQPPGLIERIENGKYRYEPNPKAENQTWLKEPYIEKIDGMSKHDIDMLILNKIGIAMAGKPVYPTYSETDHASEDILDAVEGFPLIVGLDGGRDPAAIVGQNVNGWTVLAELVGSSESAEEFAPRVKAMLATRFPGFEYEFWADPRYDDGNQATADTAFEIFGKFGMTVYPATTDNNVELRRSTVAGVLAKRNGLLISKSCLMLRRGMAGGYHYRKIAGTTMYSPRPQKNEYSHPVEAFENMLIGGGEGYATVRGPVRKTPASVPIKRPRMRLSRRAAR